MPHMMCIYRPSDDGENGLREELNILNTNKEVNNSMEFNPIDIVDDVLNTRFIE
ncbi:18381_t:CDS:2 [Rhizophagus irregularis]|nr:18381_t:CDS:2 [Rhizophagus irregularis]